MPIEKLTHSRLGIELVRILSNAGTRIFTNEQARQFAPSVGLSESYLRQALHYLVKTGWIVRLRKGLYALSSSVPGVSPAHEFEIAMALVNPAAISHWSALHYHGLTEQAPRRIFILTTKRSPVFQARHNKDKQTSNGYMVGDFIYQFTQVKPERFFGTDKVWVSDTRIMITDPERTLLDGLSKPNYYGGFSEVLHAFEVMGDNLNLDRIIEYSLRLNVAVISKRLGWVLEQNGINPDKLEALIRLPMSGYRPLDPTGSRKGLCNRRWMIQENLPGKVMS